MSPARKAAAPARKAAPAKKAVKAVRKAAAPPTATFTPAQLLGPLAKAIPDWGPTLEFSSPFELLVATILAAQARDDLINQVTRVVFKKYKGPRAFAAAPTAELERDLQQTGFFRQKTAAVQAASRGLLDLYGGEVPGDMESLVKLKGVGRKTASIVLGNAFGVPSIAVDRHVIRVSGRLGLSRSEDPDQIELDLQAFFPKKEWVKATWLLVLHGRRTCMPTPLCPECPVRAICPYPNKTS